MFRIETKKITHFVHSETFSHRLSSHNKQLHSVEIQKLYNRLGVASVESEVRFIVSHKAENFFNQFLFCG